MVFSVCFGIIHIVINRICFIFCIQQIVDRKIEGQCTFVKIHILRCGQIQPMVCAMLKFFQRAIYRFIRFGFGIPSGRTDGVIQYITTRSSYIHQAEREQLGMGIGYGRFQKVGKMITTLVCRSVYIDFLLYRRIGKGQREMIPESP